MFIISEDTITIKIDNCSSATINQMSISLHFFWKNRKLYVAEKKRALDQICFKKKPCPFTLSPLSFRGKLFRFIL